MGTFTPLLYGSFMASIDVFIFTILKLLNTGVLTNMWWMVIPTAVYSLQPWIFLRSLQVESMIVMNLIWNLLSDLFVTTNGLIFLKEKLSHTKMAGVLLSIIGIYLMSCEKAEIC